MKDILLFVRDDAGLESRLSAALDLVRAVDGHLLCCDVVQYPVVTFVDPMMGNADAVLLADAQDRADQIRAKVEDRLKAEAVDWKWQDGIGDLPTLLAQAGGLADIIVLNTALNPASGPNMAGLIGDVVKQVHTPVLAVPQNCGPIDFTGAALVAWNGSTAVLDTLNAVVSLLKLASSVTLVEIGETGGAALEEGIEHLGHHGITAQQMSADRNGQPAGVALAHLCEKLRPSYCVMGAYGHSRLREQLFGGVTRHMLENTSVPLLLSH